MENRTRDTAKNAAPQDDWQNAENKALPQEAITNERNEGFSGEPIRYRPQEDDAHVHAMAYEDDDEEDDEDFEEDNDEENGDWGHVDPYESNSPFPDPNAPSAPGSAV